PLDPGNVTVKTDQTHGMTRTEVRSAHADSHLGHLFPDGPGPTGMRYCMNSASMRFIPVSKLEAEGYGKYLSLFPRSPLSDRSLLDSSPSWSRGWPSRPRPGWWSIRSRA